MGNAIEVENISKAYQLGQFNTGTLSKDLQRWWALQRGKEDPFLKIGEVNDRSVKGESNIVWSLKGINFKVEAGEAVGIIGRNGAGKSTLLKILSQVTTPTTGKVKVRGRIASLLEVGTGFHPELTGRENIFLNGAILGMRKKEISKKFDEIVDFSGVERYIDTPVKRYSSGMYVRLAFAVAAYLESEILIVDEVLAVGDAEFQKKCLGKMNEVSKGEGRTILFVSHNMAAIKSLCSSAIVLENGTLVLEGATNSAVTNYLRGDADHRNTKRFNNELQNDYVNLIEVSVSSLNHSNEAPLNEKSEIQIRTTFYVKKEAEKLHFTYVLSNENGEALFSFSHAENESFCIGLGENILCCKFPTGFLNIGSYYLTAYLIKDSREAVFIEQDILVFDVHEGARPLGAWMGREPGFIKPKFQWSMEHKLI